MRIGLKQILMWAVLPLGLAAPSFAEDSWKAGYARPCVCDASLHEAIPAVFANRLRPEHQSDFIEVMTGLIRGFTADAAIPNSKKVILWSVMNMDHYDLLNALVAARRAGIEVRLVTDGKSVVAPGADSGLPPEKRAAQLREIHFTRDIADRLRAAGARVSYSKPEWVPSTTRYAPLMHEKIRIFGIRNARGAVQPLLAYVSTHNDSYSDTQGDIRPDTPESRVQAGGLARGDFIADSQGNVQTSFVVRHAGILQSLTRDFLDQESVYGEGSGTIGAVPRQAPQDFSLADGSRVRVAYTYGAQRGPNPNVDQSDFIESFAAAGAGAVDAVWMQQFVFSYAKEGKALKALAANSAAPSMDLVIDGNFAWQPYSQVRAMAGLYSVLPYRKGMPIEYPWKKDLRARVRVAAYVNGHDKLHTKNSLVRYHDAAQGARVRIFTGSLNLSGNGAANKEVSFEIDTAAAKTAAQHALVDVIDEQRQVIMASPYTQPLAEGALWQRVLRMGNAAGARLEDNAGTRRAFNFFLRALGGGQLTLPGTSNFAAPGRQAPFEDSWLGALERFYGEAGALAAGQSIVADARRNLPEAKRFWVSVPSLEIFLQLTEDQRVLDPDLRAAVLDLFR